MALRVPYGITNFNKILWSTVSNIFVRSMKTPKYNCYYHKISKFHFPEELLHFQLNGNQTDFHKK